MKITPTTLTISQLFSSTNEQFLIPAYQRRYSWQKKQLAELFDDISCLKSNDTHLLGSVVCLTYTHSAGINPLELVDGQQRITTLSILLRALQKRYEELDKDDIVKEINNYLLCKGIDRKPKNKVLLGDLDETDYKLVLTQKNLSEIKNDKLLSAYTDLKLWIDELATNDLHEFYFKLINNVLVIRLDVGDAKNAYRLFETINNRGLKLDNTDIIKNFLLGHASTIENDTLDTVRDNWKSLIISLDRIDTDKFFRQYISGIRTYKVTDTYVIDEFKKYYFAQVKEAESLSEFELYSELPIDDPEEIEDELGGEGEPNAQEESQASSGDARISIIDFSSKLKYSSNIYSQILNRQFQNPKINQHLFNLQRIKSFPSYIFLLNVLQRIDLDWKILPTLFQVLETFMLRRHICEYRTGELDNIFSKLVPIPSSSIIKDVKDQLSKDLPSNSEFSEKFQAADFRKETNRAKYILEQIEYHLIQDKNEYILQTGNEVHLEHIIPQTIDTKKSKKEFGDWEDYLGNDAMLHKQNVNKIGNFTLISGELNIKASNNPFKAKLAEYKKSNIQLTKNICTEYAQKRFDFDAVQERCKQFSNIAVQIWSF